MSIIDVNFSTRQNPIYLTACCVQPFLAKWNDDKQVTHLGVKIINDDLLTTCFLSWQLMDDNGLNLVNGNMEITGDDYKSWSGDNEYPFNYVANKLNVTIIQPPPPSTSTTTTTTTTIISSTSTTTTTTTIV